MWAARAGCSVLLLLLLVALQGLALDVDQRCSKNQYLEGSRCCNKCRPGQKVTTKCSGETDTGCEPCEAHHYQADWTKEEHCTPHRYCDENADLAVWLKGTAEQDVVCRCKQGTHCSSQECQTCRPNKLCGPGQGVLQPASHEDDTVCGECPVGFFSDNSSATAQCQQWSSCQDKGLAVKAKGTRTSDVICGQAQRGHLLALVLIPVAAVILAIGLVLWHRCRGGPQKPFQHQVAVEVEEEEQQQQTCPGFPTQETLPEDMLGAQEEGKDSRLAQQEQQV